MPAVATRTEYLEFDAFDTIAAIPLNTPAWECESYADFYDITIVGNDRAIPGVPGRLFQPRELDEHQVTLRVTIFGFEDWEGTPYDDPRVGVRLNRLYLRDNLLLPQTTARPVTLYRLDGTTATGDVVVVPPFQPVMAGPAACRVTINLLVVAGVLTELGS